MRNRELLAGALCLVLAGVVYLALAESLRPGHDWGGDFSLYLLHARNLARGVPYDAVPFVYNPGNLFHSPRLYPPIYPLLLAPVYARYGLDFHAFKLITCLFLPLSSLAIFYLAKRALPWPDRLWLAALTGFSPILFTMKDNVLSDLPYTFVSLCALWFGSELAASPRSLRLRVWGGIGLGLLVYLAYGLRAPGLTLLGAFIASDVLRNRRLGTQTAALLATFVVAAATAAHVTHYGDSSYYQQFAGLTTRIVADNAMEYVRSFAFHWYNGYSKTIQYFIFFATLPLAAAGYIRRCRSGFSVVELYFVFYLLLLLVWPGTDGVRYIVPVIPLYLYYIFCGLRALPLAAYRFGLAALLVAAAGTYGARYVHLPTGPIQEGILLPEFAALCETVRQSTGDSDLIAFWNPRVLALMTERRATPYASTGPEGIWPNLQALGVSHVILTKTVRDEEMSVIQSLAEHREDIEEIYSNPVFTLYRLQSRRQQS